ncbi:MAG TPA: MarR family transcriptional regulator [Candidatus Paceibacterota bacterium]|nr:MarR family transcriptional regulator [Candidatus Paceibacterota bacterium]HPT18252.1 MarR family transcriptional regulator [Candidatus Paceibacterota bacterium]
MKKIVLTRNRNLDRVLMMFRHSMTTFLLEEAKETGLSLSHFEILMYIAERGSITMKEIASWLHITPPSASVLVKILIEKGMIERVNIHNKKDRREVYVRLGVKGENMFRSIHNKKMHIFKKMFLRLGKKDKEDLARILIKCVPN